VDPRAGLDDVEKRKFLTLPGLELRPLCRPAHCQSLYRLRYPGTMNQSVYFNNNNNNNNNNISQDQLLVRRVVACNAVMICY
jgi:hypothetical protein